MKLFASMPAYVDSEFYFLERTLEIVEVHE